MDILNQQICIRRNLVGIILKPLNKLVACGGKKMTESNASTDKQRTTSFSIKPSFPMTLVNFNLYLNHFNYCSGFLQIATKPRCLYEPHEIPPYPSKGIATSP
ncbi:hypothetical protein FRC03_003704 [Tulasnella sp. 419]|nr:hypothetical protein FRC03_003704 [Tulasnella sp. 419]